MDTSSVPDPATGPPDPTDPPNQGEPMTALRPLASRPAAAVVLGLGVVGALAGCSTAADTGSGSSGSGSGSFGTYTDGSYAGSGDYQTPDSANVSIDVKVTLKDDLVTDIEVLPNATSGNAKQYQDQFASGIKDVSVGKHLEELADVTRVAGSSLTHLGFRKAIEQIEKLAAAK
jgi:uncharacterized protein with FMN-binding domain